MVQAAAWTEGEGTWAQCELGCLGKVGACQEHRCLLVSVAWLGCRPGQKKVPALFPLLSSSLRGGHARAERRSQWRHPIQASDSQHPAAARRDKSRDEPLTALQEQVAEQPTRPKSKSSQNKIGGGKCEGWGGTWLLLLLGPEKAPCLRTHTVPENAENDFENAMPAAQLAASPTPFHTTRRHTPAH